MLPDRVSNPGPLTYESGALGKNRNWCLRRDMDHLANSTAELRQGGNDCLMPKT